MGLEEPPFRVSHRSQPRFSLLTIFGLTAVVAILAAVPAILPGSYSRGLRSLLRVWGDGALALSTNSSSVLIACLPVLGVFVAYFKRVVGMRRLAFASILLYSLALAVPAIGSSMPEIHTVWGFNAFLLCFMGTFWGIASWVIEGRGDFWLTLASTMGAVANISFIIGYIAYTTFAIRHKGIWLANWTATLGCCLAALVIVPLAVSRELHGVYLGHGLWVASFLALTLGSWGMLIGKDLPDDNLNPTA